MCKNCRCVIRDCPNEKGTSKHRFPNPANDLYLFERWLQYCEESVQSQPPEKIYINRRVCGKHFLDTQFGPKRRLLKTAYPVLNLPGKLF